MMLKHKTLTPDEVKEKYPGINKADMKPQNEINLNLLN